MSEKKPPPFSSKRRSALGRRNRLSYSASNLETISESSSNAQSAGSNDDRADETSLYAWNLNTSSSVSNLSALNNSLLNNSLVTSKSLLPGSALKSKCTPRRSLLAYSLNESISGSAAKFKLSRKPRESFSLIDFNTPAKADVTTESLDATITDNTELDCTIKNVDEASHSNTVEVKIPTFKFTPPETPPAKLRERLGMKESVIEWLSQDYDEIVKFCDDEYLVNEDEFFHKIFSLQEELEESRAQIDLKNKHIHRLESIVISSEQLLKQKEDDFNCKISSLQEELEQSQNELKVKEQSIQRLDSLLKLSEKQLKEKEDDFNSKISGLQEELDLSKNEVRLMEQNIQKLESLLNLSEQHLQEKEEDFNLNMSSLKDELELKKNEVTFKDESIRRLEALVNSAKQQIKEMDDDIYGKISSLQEELELSKDEVNFKDQSIQRMESLVKLYEQQLKEREEELNLKVSSLEEELNHSKMLLETGGEEIQKLKSLVKSYEEQLRQKEDKISETAEELLVLQGQVIQANSEAQKAAEESAAWYMALEKVRGNMTKAMECIDYVGLGLNNSATSLLDYLKESESQVSDSHESCHGMISELTTTVDELKLKLSACRDYEEHLRHTVQSRTEQLARACKALKDLQEFSANDSLLDAGSLLHVSVIVGDDPLLGFDNGDYQDLTLSYDDFYQSNKEISAMQAEKERFFDYLHRYNIIESDYYIQSFDDVLKYLSIKSTQASDVEEHLRNLLCSKEEQLAFVVDEIVGIKILMEDSCNNLSRFKLDISNLEEQVKSLSDTLPLMEHLRSCIMSKEDQLAMLTDHYEKLKKTLNATNEMLTSKKDAIDSLENEVTSLQQVLPLIEHMKNQLKSKETQVKILSEKYNSTRLHNESIIAMKDKTICDLEKEVITLKDKVDVFDHLKNVIESKEQQLDLLQQNLNSLTLPIMDHLRSCVMSKEDQLSVLTGHYKELLVTLDSTNEMLTCKKDAIDSLENEVSSLRQLLPLMENMKDDLSIKEELIKSLSQDRESLEAKNNQLSTELHDSQGKIKEMEQISCSKEQLEDMHDTNEHLRNVIISREEQLYHLSKAKDDLSNQVMEFCHSLMRDSSFQSSDCKHLFSQASELVQDLIRQNAQNQETMKSLLQNESFLKVQSGNVAVLEQLLSEKELIVSEQKEIINYLNTEVESLTEAILFFKSESDNFDQSVETYYLDVLGWQEFSLNSLYKSGEAVTSLLQELQILKDDVSKKDNVISSLNLDSKSLEANNNELLAELNECHENIKQLEAMLCSKDNEICSLESKAVSLQVNAANVSSLEHNIEILKKELDQACHNREVLYEKYESSIATLLHEIDILKTGMSQQKFVIDTKTGVIQQLEAENSSLKLIIEGESKENEVLAKLVDWLQEIVTDSSGNMVACLNEVEGQLSSLDHSISIDLSLSGFADLRRCVADLKDYNLGANSSLMSVRDEIPKLMSHPEADSSLAGVLMPPNMSFTTENAISFVVPAVESIDQLESNLIDLHAKYYTNILKICSSLLLQEVDFLQESYHEIEREVRLFFKSLLSDIHFNFDHDIISHEFIDLDLEIFPREIESSVDNVLDVNNLFDFIECESKHIIDTFSVGMRIIEALGQIKSNKTIPKLDESRFVMRRSAMDEPSRILGYETLNVSDLSDTSPEKTNFLLNNFNETKGAFQVDPFKSIICDKTFSQISSNYWLKEDTYTEGKEEDSAASDSSMNQSLQFHDALDDPDNVDTTLTDTISDFCQFVLQLDYFSLPDCDNSMILEAVKSELLSIKDNLDLGCGYLNESHPDIKSLINSSFMKLADSQEKLSALQRKFAKVKRSCKLLEGKVTSLKEEKYSLSQAFSVLNEMICGSHQSISTFMNNLVDNNSKEKNQILQRLTHSDELLKNSEIKVSALKEKIIELETSLEAIKEAKLEEKLQAAESELSICKDQCSAYLEEINSLNVALTEKKSQFAGVVSTLKETEELLLKTSAEEFILQLPRAANVNIRIKEELSHINEKVQSGSQANYSLDQLYVLANDRGNKLFTILGMEGVPSRENFKSVFEKFDHIPDSRGSHIVAKYDHCLELLFNWTLKQIASLHEPPSKTLSIVNDPYHILKENYTSLQSDFNDLQEKYLKMQNERSSFNLSNPQDIIEPIKKILTLLSLNDNIDSCYDLNTHLSKIANRIELMNALLNELRLAKVSNSSVDVEFLKTKMNSLESQVQETVQFRNSLIKDIRDLKPDQFEEDLEHLPLIKLYSTLIESIMVKENIVVETLTKDYDAKVKSLTEKVGELEGVEKNRANWVETVERENSELILECDQLKKDVRNLKDELSNKITYEHQVAEELDFLEMKLRQQSEDASASRAERLEGEFGNINAINDPAQESEVSGPLISKVRQIRKNIVYGDSTFVYFNHFDGAVKDLKQAKIDLEIKYLDLEEQCLNYRSQIIEANNSRTEALAQHAAALRETTSLKKEVEDLTEKSHKYEAEISALSFRIGILQEDLGKAKELKRKYEGTFEEELQSMGKAYQELVSEKEYMEKKIETLTSENEMLILQNSQFKSKLTEISRELDTIKGKLEKECKQNSILIEQVASQKKHEESLELKNNDLKSQLDERIKSETVIEGKLLQESRTLEIKLIQLEKQVSSLTGDNCALETENKKLKSEIINHIKEFNVLNSKHVEGTKRLQESIEANTSLRQELISNKEDFKTQLNSLRVQIGEDGKEHERTVESYKLKIAEYSKQIATLENLKNSKIVHLENKLQEAELARLRGKTSLEKVIIRNKQLSEKLATAEADYLKEKEMLKLDIEQHLSQIKRLEEALSGDGDNSLREALVSQVERALGPLSSNVLEIVLMRISTFEKLSEDLADAKDRITELDAECELIAKESTGETKLRQDVEVKLYFAEEELKKIRPQIEAIADLRNENKKLKEEIGKHKDRVKRMEEEVSMNANGLGGKLVSGIESALGQLSPAVIETAMKRISSFEQLANQLEDAKEHVASLDAECEEMAKECKEEREMRDKFERKLCFAEKELESIRQKSESDANVARETVQLQNKIISLETLLQEEQQTNRSQVEMIISLRTEISKLKTALNNVELSEAILKNQLDSMPSVCSGCAGLEKRLAESKALLQERECSLSKLNAQISAQSLNQQSIERYRSKILELKDENERLKNEIVRVPDSNSTLKPQQENLPPTDDVQAKVKALEQRVEKLTKDRALLKKLCDKRKEKIDALEKYMNTRSGSSPRP